MIIRVGQIPYLNCEPFFYGLDLEGIDLYPMPPRAMGPLAQALELDAGPFSLVQCFDLEDRYEPLGDMGISVKGSVQSILFYSRVPIERLSGGTVGVTEESATAVQLMKVLLEQRYQVQPEEYTSLDTPRMDALLLIGDPALLTHGHVEGFPHCYDLAEEWRCWKDLPFVFALWMVRRDLEPGLKRMLSDGLRKNLASNMSCNLKVISDKRAGMGMTQQQVVEYLRAFRYVLSEEDWRATEVFKRAWRSLPLAKEATT